MRPNEAQGAKASFQSYGIRTETTIKPQIPVMLPLSTVELWASGVGEGNSFYLRLRRGRLWKASFKDELGLPRLRRGTAYQAEETAHTKPRWLERGKSAARWEKGVIRLSAGSGQGWRRKLKRSGRALHTATERSFI